MRDLSGRKEGRRTNIQLGAHYIARDYHVKLSLHASCQRKDRNDRKLTNPTSASRPPLHRKTKWSKSDFLLALFCKITFALWIMSESRWWLARDAFEALFRSVSFRPFFLCRRRVQLWYIPGAEGWREKLFMMMLFFVWILSTCGIFYHLPDRRFKGLSQPDTERVATCFTPFVVFSWKD